MPTQPQGDLKGLKALVGILGVLVILGTALVIGVVMHRLYAKPATASMTMAPAPSMPTAATSIPGVQPGIKNSLPAGDSIKSITTAGPDLAIWVSGPTGDKLLLLNPITDKLTLALTAAPTN